MTYTSYPPVNILSSDKYKQLNSSIPAPALIKSIIAHEKTFHWDFTALGLTNNDPITTASDSSGKGNDATAIGTTRPTFKTGGQNGKSFAQFDGVDDYMSFPTEECRTLFIVCKWTGEYNIAYPDILGALSLAPLHAPNFPSDKMIDSASSSLVVRNGTARVDGLSCLPLNVLKLKDVTIIMFKPTEPISLNQIARNQNVTGRVWRGEIYEIIGFEHSLIANDEDITFASLYSKYNISAPSSYHASTLAFFNRIDGKLATVNRDLIDTFIRGLVNTASLNPATSLMDELDFIGLLCLSTKQASDLNLKSALFESVIIGISGFTPEFGYEDTSRKRSYNPSLITGYKYTLNSHTVGAYLRTTGGGHMSGIVGITNSMETYVDPKVNGAFVLKDNIGSGITVTHPANSIDIGLISMQRRSSTQVKAYRNSSLLFTHNQTTESLADGEYYFGATNVNNGPVGRNTRQTACEFAGSGDIDIAALFTLIEAFMDGKGIGVV